MNAIVDRRSANAYPFQCQINTRFTDTDLAGHLNNVSILVYYQDGLAPFLMECFPEQTAAADWSLRQSRCDVSYDGQGYYPDPMRIACGIAEIGDTWFRVAQAQFQRDQCVGQSDTVLLLLDKQGQPLALTTEQRARLEERRLRSSADPS